MTQLDTLQRPLRNLRISVTDRCNLRCSYCMPEEEYAWLPKSSILSFEEIARLVDAFSLVGVHKLRLTGGEPLLRRDVAGLVKLLCANERMDSVAMTTNGVLLAGHAQELFDAGLERVTISLDSLRPERVKRISRRDCLPSILEGIERVGEVGFKKTKVDTVVMRGVNDDELVDLIEFSKQAKVEVRFIEYMDVGGATRWSSKDVVSRAEILQCLRAYYGTAEQTGERNSAPADRYELPDGTVFGVISSTTQPFCAACDRARLTADGTWYMCLYANEGKDLRTPLREGASAEELAALLSAGWARRTDRGAEERLEQTERGALLDRSELATDPHLEMHTRGG
jgi:cyclic pyranopterin phosphate synthase